MNKIEGNRGSIFYYLENDLIHLYLGDRESPESEWLTTFHEHYLKEVIAALSLLKETK